jgi:hypothetical protein
MKANGMPDGYESGTQGWSVSGAGAAGIAKAVPVRRAKATRELDSANFILTLVSSRVRPND